MGIKKNNEEFNRMDQFWSDFVLDFQMHKKLYIAGFVGVVIISIIFVSWLTQYILWIFGKQDGIYIGELVTKFASNPISLVLTGVCIVVLSRLAYRTSKLMEKDYVQNTEENYKVSKYGVYGDAHWQTEEERKECFERTKDINEMYSDILGRDNKGYLYALRTDLLSVNKNKIAFGASRSGKSAAIVENEIFQCIRRGESMIVTDSKGDVYRNTAYVAKIYGYIVRVLNLKAKELKNSDSWEPLKYVTLEDEIQAEVLAKAIIENTEDGPMDYWAKNEMNALKATILLVATTENYKNNRSMREVVNIITEPATFESKFMGLPDDNPAKNAFNIFAACKDDVKKQILNGMGIRLSLLNNKYIKEIVSHDEIDLILPMKRKCIYYIIISDTDTAMKFVASMFFTQAFMAQCDYSDGLSKKAKQKQLPVRYELDEFKNIGAIPFFDVKISTFASRKISSTLILQGITQLEELYPRKAHQIILANTTTKILLKAGDEETAKYFSTLCGILTVKVENGRYSKGRTQRLDLHNAETVSEGLGKRELLLQDKAMKLDKDILVVCINGFQPVKLNKYIAELNHPMYKECKELKPNNHKPKWRKEIEMREAQLTERFKDITPMENVQEEEKEVFQRQLSTEEPKPKPLKAPESILPSKDCVPTRKHVKDEFGANTGHRDAKQDKSTPMPKKLKSKEPDFIPKKVPHEKPVDKPVEKTIKQPVEEPVESGSRLTKDLGVATKGNSIFMNLLEED